jgi:hypothetical protein
MRARFWELKAKADAIRDTAAPLREARDKLVAAQMKELAKHDAKIAKVEDGLFDIDQEAATLVRAVGGRMGEPE